MYVKIQNSGKGGNSGSCSDYANYLEKENENKLENEKEHFFSSDRENIKSYEVIDSIDGNNKKLGKKEAKFFSVTFSPSSKELKSIGNDKEKLKEFTRTAMNGYAENFNKGLKGKDLLYYAKVEKERTYKGTDKEVRRGEKKQGMLKPGDNRHIHVIVSRRAKGNGPKVSPLANSKNSKGILNGRKVQKGFDRQKFYTISEQSFDKESGYNRVLEEKYQYKLEQTKLSTKEKLENMDKGLDSKNEEKGLSVKEQVKLKLSEINREESPILEKEKIKSNDNELEK
jgi:hypothetical protein